MSLGISNDCVGMVRPVWTHRQYFIDLWKQKDITVLVCQRKTKDNTRLCIESLLRFYPDIPVLIIDGDSQDDSTLYCKWMAVKHPNIRLYEKPNTNNGKHTSHGETMNLAITMMITTEYVLLLDSDTITERGGWIEQMLDQFRLIKFKANYETEEVVQTEQLTSLYAIGSLMLPGRKGEAIHPPQDESDVLRYAHPSCSIIDREKYLEIAKTFTHWPDGQVIPNIASDHGSPLVWNMMGAADLGYRVEYFPVDKYVSHLSGASWCEPKTIWPDDHDVLYRPFVTFIVSAFQKSKVFGLSQKDYDFEIVPCGVNDGKKTMVVIHGSEPVSASNCLAFGLRYNIRGEYIVNAMQYEDLLNANYNFSSDAKKKAIELNAPDEFELNGIKLISRRLFQKRECLM